MEKWRDLHGKTAFSYWNCWLGADWRLSGKIIYETGLAHSPLSDSVSKDLKKRGMKFVGTTIIYAYMQAVGVIDSHEKGCFKEHSNSQGT